MTGHQRFGDLANFSDLDPPIQDREDIRDIKVDFSPETGRILGRFILIPGNERVAGPPRRGVAIEPIYFYFSSESAAITLNQG